MATNALLGRDVYLALAAVGWADGQLTQEGADAIMRTALEEGLDLDTVAEIEEATKEPQQIEFIDRLKMSKSDRLYVYAVASWITLLDGKVTANEQAALQKLAAALNVPEAPRAHADSIMKEIAAAGDRPDRFDLIGLRRRLDEELERASAARKAGQ